MFTNTFNVTTTGNDRITTLERLRIFLQLRTAIGGTENEDAYDGQLNNSCTNK